ncbi:LuxE/PaaK family acyltransferase [Celerinatantimonas yamalensis]|uniref:Acyl-protein synthetase n=1 Tax=Celerinatantimonas yamalensis TaxID=559956 RepID=A0ABW9GAT7_9GAMM
MNDDPQAFWDESVYGLSQVDKQAWLLNQLNLLSAHHRCHCHAYQTLCSAAGVGETAARYDEILPLAVRLFKHLKLASIEDDEVFKTLTSSGTGGAKSHIVLDRNTAAMQSKALVKIMQSWMGRARLPMLLVEQPSLVANRQGFSARGAGALGLSFLGRDHCYALDDSMQPNWPAIEAFAERYRDQPVLIFGFTFMLWQCLLEPLAERGISLPLSHALIFHSGGWKKLTHLAVSHADFNQRCREHLGSAQVHNFYGMAEQTGSIFVSCEHGHLHAPRYADVIIRHRQTMQPMAIGEMGLIQVFSALAHSYPGHSIVTEDLGIWLGDDDCLCGRKGRYFQVLGREQNTEVRGCSDTFN